MPPEYGDHTTECPPEAQDEPDERPAEVVPHSRAALWHLCEMLVDACTTEEDEGCLTERAAAQRSAPRN